MTTNPTSYFDSFADFQQNPHASLLQEFVRLATHRGWKPKSKRYRKQYQRAMFVEFTAYYGSATDRLGGWQALCHEVRMKKIPDTISQCRKALKRGVHVNIVDLIDARRTGARVPRFPSREALREYSLDQGKIFPLEMAKENGFLAALLIDMSG